MAELQLFIDFFILLFVVVDPIGIAPIFAALTHEETAAVRRRLALRGAGLACAILVLFAVFGDNLLIALGISLPAFQIAGGLLLFLLAVDMVFARHSGLRSTTEREQKEAEHRKDISVFPLAIPLIAGPGALTTVLLMVGARGEEPLVISIVVLVIALVLLLALASLLAAPWILKWMGQTGAAVVTRLLGIILTALAVQYVVDGIGAALGPLQDLMTQTLTV
jgi:multiple antibiotic resistance protein